MRCDAGPCTSVSVNPHARDHHTCEGPIIGRRALQCRCTGCPERLRPSHRPHGHLTDPQNPGEQEPMPEVRRTRCVEQAPSWPAEPSRHDDLPPSRGHINWNPWQPTGSTRRAVLLTLPTSPDPPPAATRLPRAPGSRIPARPASPALPGSRAEPTSRSRRPRDPPDEPRPRYVPGWGVLG